MDRNDAGSVTVALWEAILHVELGGLVVA